MDRRFFLKVAGAAACVPAATWTTWARAVAAGVADPYAQILEDVLARAPESATTLGLDLGPRAALKHRLDDRSPGNRLSYFQALIDAAPVPAGESIPESRNAIFRATVLWFAESIGRFRAFPYGGVGGYSYPVPYAVSQLTGAYQSVPDFLATQHTIAGREDAEAYLDRLAAFATAIDQDTEHARADAALGVVPPAVILDRTISQLRSFEAGQRGPGAGLVASLARRTTEQGIAGEWPRRAQALVDGPIASAIARQLAAMERLRRNARTPVGVDRLPDGEGYYDACLTYHTSTALSPRDAHELGLQQVTEISARARGILDGAGIRGTPLAAGIRSLMAEPKYLYPNDDAGRAALLAYISALVRDMTERLPRVFSRLPKTPLEVRRVPPAIELGAPGAYSLSGSLDGTRPGGIYFNLHDTANWPKWTVATTAYHEGVPGHHLQGSIANEAAEIPTLFKLLNSNAYTEGWALYAEQLADELGAYDAEPLGRLGMLQASLFRACRIVVDTGMHARGWSRERAIAYLIDHAGATPDDARREIERYVSWPGQACGYKIGHLEILRLREHARMRLGGRFDLKGFHDAVLSYGSVPLEVLSRAVDAWIAATTGA
jgi:uncharacterized protein (DUF885 family)